jgi:hypothetical protein
MLQWYRDRKLRKQREKEISILTERLARYRRRLKEVDRSGDLAFALRDSITRTMAEISRLEKSLDPKPDSH